MSPELKEIPMDSFEKKLLVDIFRLFTKFKLFNPSQLREIYDDFSENRKRLGTVAVLKGWINKEQFDVIWDLYRLVDGNIRRQPGPRRVSARQDPARWTC